MSIFNSFVYGDISGRNGNAVASVVKGVNVLRRYKKPSDPRTPAQLAIREKFAFVMRALYPFRPVIKYTLGSGSKGFGRAFSIAYKEAIVGESPELSVDWSKVVVSSGLLALPQYVEIGAQNGSLYGVEWDTEIFSNASPDDQVSLVLYNQNSHALFFLNAMAVRSGGSTTFNLPALWSATDLKVWLFFSTANRSMFSQSIYVTPVV